jgi:uncharacterized membrane protein YozB (DUF420 family)
LIPGFFPDSRATIMFDVVVVALVVLLPAVFASILLARRGKFQIHKRAQITLGATLLVAVALFEVDVQMTKLYVEGGWRSLTTPSPYHGDAINRLLAIHLVFSTTTSILWIVTIVHALRSFSHPPAPGPASPWHRRLGWASAVGLALTCLTGWTFYYMAFVAR